jgi:hypothetical protein
MSVRVISWIVLFFLSQQAIHEITRNTTKEKFGSYSLLSSLHLSMGDIFRQII